MKSEPHIWSSNTYKKKRMLKAGKICCMIIICTLFLSESHAQTKAAGASFSYAGVGVVYEHHTDADSFIDVNIRMETTSMYTIGKNPGVSASFTWNMVFAQAESGCGNIIRFFAGPGAAIGFADDFRKGRGWMLGLKGKIGGECTFSRNINVSLSISPVLGMHLSIEKGMMNMLLYKNGLMYSIMPEVGIKYAF